ncbi:MAG: cell division ATP-binding protein FtsE [Candidatus Improbicoccus devescovinae]|nr:MAG: cell division ATP-binding protein FtsE [Candidatus Improbicoccus devescovinae]
MIQIKKLCKLYKNSVPALNNINMIIQDSEFLFIIGASGSGKSTLLKIILKEEEATSGSIYVDGENILKMRRRSIPYYRRKIGVVYQDFRLIENINVFDNVAFAMRILGAPDKDIRRRVPQVLSSVNLADKAYRRPCELSGGEKQRVGLARALVNRPKIIIADEPTGNIDPNMSYEIVELLANFNKAGTCVIMVTHDVSVVAKFGFRIVELANGAIRGDTGCFS